MNTTTQLRQQMLQTIADHPGCTRTIAIGKAPTQTRQYRGNVLQALIQAGFIACDSTNPSHHHLTLTDKGHAALAG